MVIQSRVTISAQSDISSEFLTKNFVPTLAHTLIQNPVDFTAEFFPPLVAKIERFPAGNFSRKVTWLIPRTINIYSLYLSINDLYWSLSIFLNYCSTVKTRILIKTSSSINPCVQCNSNGAGYFSLFLAVKFAGFIPPTGTPILLPPLEKECYLLI